MISETTITRKTDSHKKSTKFITYLKISIFLISILLMYGNNVYAYKASKNIWNYQARLCQFRVEQGPIWLKHTLATNTMYIPISPRLDIKKAVLHLVFSSSKAIDTARSHLRILLHGIVVAQIPLGSGNAEAAINISLPVSLLKPGYNILQFQAVQHYSSSGCESPNAPELWTEIDTVQSEMLLQMRFKPVRASLAALNEFVGKRLWGTYTLTVISPDKKLSRNELKWGALVTMAVAERLKFLNLNVKLTNLPSIQRKRRIYWRRLKFPKIDFSHIDSDAVLIGTKSQLKAFLPNDIIKKITGAFLGIYAQDDSPDRYILIISGDSPEEVTKAATVLDFLNFPLPDCATTIIKGLKIPKLPPDSGENRVTYHSTYTFKSLGLDTTTLKRIRPQNLTLMLWLPPDLYTNEYANVKIKLHMAYGAGMRKDSVLNIYLNNHFQTAIHLNNTDGSVFQNYEIDIPFRSFKPGPNAITFQARLIPSITGSCVFINDSNLLFTLFSDSTVTIPMAQHLVQLPNLKLFQNSGFPLNKDPYGSNLCVDLTNDNPDTIASAWILLGKLTQITGVALYKASLGYVANKSKDILLVGTADQVNAPIMKNSPITFGKDGRITCPSPLREPQRLAQDSSDMSWMPAWMSQAFCTNPKTSTLKRKTVTINLDNSLGHYISLMEFESPFKKDNTIITVLASKPSLLYKGVRSIVKPNLWYNLHGSVAIWYPDGGHVWCQQVAQSYIIGNAGTSTHLIYAFSEHPFYWLITLIVLIGAFALTTYWLLNRFKNRHHPADE